VLSTPVSPNIFFGPSPPSELDLSVWPPLFVEVTTYEKELLYVQIVDVFIRIYL
jgi:hypothetical protein